MPKIDALERDLFFIKLLEDKIWIVDPVAGTVYNNKTKKFIGTVRKENNKIALNYMVKGYLHNITKNRLIWISQHGPVQDNMFVCVIDESKPPSIDNLQTLSPSEASKLVATRSNRVRKGVSTLKDFSPEKVLDLRRDYKNTKFNINKKADELGMSHMTLKSLLTGKTFGDVPEACVIQTKVKDPDNIREKQRLRMQQYRKTAPKPVIQPKPKPVIQPKPKPVFTEQEPEEKSVVVDPSYLERRRARERQRQEQEDLIEQRESERLSSELALRRKEKEKRDRFLAIRRAADKLRLDKKARELSPFKEFAVYHLIYKLKSPEEEVKRLLHVDGLHIKTVLETFPADEYEARRTALIEKFGRESKMLSQIRMFEGDSDHML